MKTLKNTDQDAAKKNVPDMVTFGGDQFKLLSKASSEAEGWMKSTKAMEVPGLGCVVQVTTQQMSPNGQYALAEACCFVPDATMVALESADGVVMERVLVPYADVKQYRDLA